ncbi:MAG: pilus assembly protein N-terminal domain-containing protein [Candidatus Latescibacterota bacterium]
MLPIAESTLPAIPAAPRGGRRGLGTLAIVCFVILAGLRGSALAVPVTPVQQRRVEVGKSIVLGFPEKVETVSLANDQIADVVAVTTDEIAVIGKQVGTTTLAVWGQSQGHQIFEIRVVRDFTGLQIMLEVQVGEVNRSALSELGVDFVWDNNELAYDGNLTVGSFGGQVRTPSVPLTVGEGVSALFHFLGTQNQISAIVHALQERGQLKLLATPRLLSLSGQKASFLSGGEIPIPIASTSIGALQQITIYWKEYGVKLSFTPTVIDSNLISLEIQPEVSSLDYANAVTIAGFSIPAMLTRKASAMVELHSGEAILLGGLIADEELVSRRRVPILGRVPLLGLLFTRKETSRRQNELVFVVSPRIVGPAPEEPIPPMPWNGIEDGLERLNGGSLGPRG